VENYRGLVKFFPQPFTPTDHEALEAEDVFMARYWSDGTIRPLDRTD
jgi:branched-chain amino acid transport system substrate-binding protein